MIVEMEEENLATSLTLTEETITLTKPERASLSAIILPEEASRIIQWTSSNTDVVNVNGDEDFAILIPVAPGTATITATTTDGSNLSATCLVTVKLRGQSLALTEIPAMTYGDVAYDLPETTAEGLTLSWAVEDTDVAEVNGNMLTIKGTGTTTVTASQAGNDDYEAFSREFTLTVNKAPLTITANDCTKEEGEENPELTVSYEGFVYDDDASSLTSQPVVTTTATVDSPAGTYPITVSGAESDNYEISYVNGTLTVTEASATIVVTDISQMENVIYIEPVEVISGCQAVLSVKMKNNAAIQTIQFDLYLPEGVTVVANEDDQLITASKERINRFNYFESSIQTDGALRLLAQATSTNVPAGDGEICTVTVNIAESMEEGDYPIIFRGILMTERDNTNHSPDPNFVQTKLTVYSYVPGDANNDQNINAIDFNMIGNHILGHSQNNFNIRAADINSDGDVNAIDFNMVANIILHGNSSASRASRTEKEMDPD